MTASFAIGFIQQEDELLTHECFLFEACISAVKEFNRVAFLDEEVDNWIATKADERASRLEA